MQRMDLLSNEHISEMNNSNDYENMKKPFMRKQYKLLEQFHESIKAIAILVGPRKVGKTILLKQFASNHNATYYDFKSNYDSAFDAWQNLNLNNGLYIFDEFTYLEEYDRELGFLSDRISEYVASGKKIGAKILISGSQSVALQHFTQMYFASLSEYIRVNFLSYEEFLEWGGLSASKESFNNFIFNGWKFNQLSSNQEYLEACLEETIISCDKSYQRIRALQYVNDDSLLESTRKLLYMLILKLHSPMTWKRMQDTDKFVTKISHDFRVSNKDIDKNELRDSLNQSLMYNALSATRLTFSQIKNSLMFLIRSGLVIMNFDEDDNINHFFKWLDNSEELNNITNADEFFANFNPIITCPTFYINVLKDILQRYPYAINIEDIITTDTFGSLLECYVKGEYAFTHSSNYVKQWSGNEGKEIDLVTEEGILIEISAGKKPDSSTHFKFYPDSRYDCLIISDGSIPEGQYKRISYWDFCASL